MNGSAEDRASESSDRKGWRDAVLSWPTARRMLPLVRSIVGEVLHCREELARRLPEMDRLDRQKRDLAWPERQRRYQLREEVRALDRTLDGALNELDALAVALLNPENGQVGFPTLVNDRRAFFSWRPGEENLQYWHFAGESSRRPIPAAWVKGEPGEAPVPRESK